MAMTEAKLDSLNRQWCQYKNRGRKTGRGLDVCVDDNPALAAEQLPVNSDVGKRKSADSSLQRVGRAENAFFVKVTADDLHADG